MTLLVPSEPIEPADDCAPAANRTSRHAPGTGVWLPKEVVDWILRAGLRRPSSWSVLLAIIFRQYRYGAGATAYVTINDLCLQTGYSEATVKRALRDLKGRQLVRRRHRYRDVQFVMPKAVVGGIAKVIPRTDQQDEPSPISSISYISGEVHTPSHRPSKLDLGKYTGRLPQRISRVAYLRAVELLVSRRSTRQAI